MTYTKPVWLLFHSEYNFSRYFGYRSVNWSFSYCPANVISTAVLPIKSVCWNRKSCAVAKLSCSYRRKRGQGSGGGGGVLTLLCCMACWLLDRAWFLSSKCTGYTISRETVLSNVYNFVQRQSALWAIMHLSVAIGGRGGGGNPRGHMRA